MSRELIGLLDRGAGTSSAQPDVAALWQRGRRRRRVKQLSAGAGTLTAIVLAAVVVLPALDGTPDRLEIGPADAPRTAELPQVPLPDPESPPVELPQLTEPTGSLVVATRDGSATFIDVDRMRVVDRQLDELAPGDPIERLVAGDRLVLYGANTTYAMDPEPDGDPEPIIKQSGSSVFVSSGVSDRVWIRPGTTDGAPADIMQIDVDGQQLLGPTESPGGNLAVGLRDLVVLQRDSQLIVWDPTADEIVDTVDGTFPMGTDGQRFAWCDDTCRRLHLTDPDAGTTRLVAELPDGVSFAGYDGRISPDGRHLATPVCTREGDERRCALSVLDLTAGQAWTVADGWFVGQGALGWTPDGQRLFLHLTDGRLASYRPGDHEVSVIDVDPIPRPYGFGVVDAPTAP